MPHSINKQGKIIINLDDYNHISTVRNRDRVRNLCEPLQRLDGIKYFSIFINFADGTKFSISNMPLWSIAYHTLGYFRVDADKNPMVGTDQGYFIHNTIKYDTIQDIILRDLMGLYRIYPVFALFRKCLECEIIAEAYHELYIERPLAIYQNYRHLFEKFCIHFIEKILDLILEVVPDHRYDKFIINAEYRQQVLKGITADKNLTSREKECILWASQGKTSEEISIILGISKRTVETIINNAKHKLNCTNIAHLIAKCIKYQLLTEKVNIWWNKAH